MALKYKRVLLKLSGEALSGPEKYGIHMPTLQNISQEIKEIHANKVEVAIVIGAGNIFRGLRASAEGMDRAPADYMGMIGTVINALALQNALEKEDIPTRVQSAIQMEQVCEPYIRRRAMRHLEKGRIVILSGGTGNPYFSTDTAAALRAAEIHADVILKATKVDGVFDKDPMEHPDAKLFKELSYMDVLNRKLRVMDSTAITLCMENQLPILVFNMREKGNILRVIQGDAIGTIVHA